MTAAASLPLTTAAPFLFQARWPNHLNPELKSVCAKVRECFWKALSIILFPILLIKCCMRSCRRALFSKAILPGSNIPPVFLNAMGEDLLKRFNGEKITLLTPDRVKLDAVFFPNSLKNRAIIYGFGNGEQWETIHPKWIDFLLSTGANLILVNPRSVGMSDPVSPDEKGLSLDIWSAYDFLMREKKIDPSRILSIGHSMGGAISAIGAACAQKECPEKKDLFNQFTLIF